MGGAALDPSSGERNLVKRLRAINVNTHESPYSWDDIHTIANAAIAVPKGDKIAIGGDSLGSNEAVAIANALKGKRDIDLLFGFQRSDYGVQGTVPSNVIQAVDIYNPYWWQTLGLGNDPWTLEPGNTRTKLLSVPIAAPHPGDFGVAQDIVFNYIKHLTV
jgi:hypothetical protein